MDDDLGIRNRELKFGKVKEVDGITIIVKAEDLEKSYNSIPYYAEVGGYVNCGGHNGDILCVVSKVQVEEVERKNVHSSTGFDTQEVKKVTLSIVGTIENEDTFTRGINRLPTINSDAFFLTTDQVNNLLGVNQLNNHRSFLVTEACREKAYLDLDKLLGRHTAILGTTGSGKSCTVASIIQSILRDYPYPRIVFFDLHNEYPAAFGHGSTPAQELKDKTQCIDWSNFSLPYWFLDLAEFVAIYYPDAGGTQVDCLKNIIVKLKKQEAERAAISQAIVSVDTPLFFDINEIEQEIDLFCSSENKNTDAKKEPFTKIINRLKTVNEDPRYRFLTIDAVSKLNLSDYFSRLLGFSSPKQKFLTILDLSGLPSEVRNVCIGVLSRLCFDYRYWDLDPQELPMTLVLEEAHTYIPEEAHSRFSLCKERVERVAKEGRKYGLSLLVVTQRPSNVSTTVLSQCGTYITLRLTNDNDQNIVKRLLPDTLAGQADLLPSLRDGEALVSGDGIQLPRKVLFKSPTPFPKSNDIEYSKAWKDGVGEKYSVDKVIRGWSLRKKEA